jgi:hypothetical protein
MSLRDLAEQDLGATLEGVTDFGWPVTVTDPAGTSVALVGQSTDIAQIIDPDTGQAVSGRLAAVALRVSSLTIAGLGLPVGIADAGSKPWVVEFDDINGAAYKFKVSHTNPDRALGIVVCILEPYE